MDQYQSFIHKSRYARWLESEGRRETWDETVNRYLDFFIEREQLNEQEALELFNAKKESTVYVGDHENDMTAAKKAGISSCAVTYSHRLKEMLLVSPEFVIDELSNLKDIV